MQRAKLFEKKIEQNRIIKEDIKSGIRIRKSTKKEDQESSAFNTKDKKEQLNIFIQKGSESRSMNIIPIHTLPGKINMADSKWSKKEYGVQDANKEASPKFIENGKNNNNVISTGLVTTATKVVKQDQHPASVFLPRRNELSKPNEYGTDGNMNRSIDNDNSPYTKVHTQHEEEKVDISKYNTLVIQTKRLTDSKKSSTIIEDKPEQYNDKS